MTLNRKALLDTLSQEIPPNRRHKAAQSIQSGHPENLERRGQGKGHLEGCDTATPGHRSLDSMFRVL